MYDPYLDALPPPSQFRRPWSPDPHDPLPSTINGREAFNQLQHETYSQEEYPRLPHRAQRREVSEVSVDALDLADYARTLRARQTEDPYPPFNRSQYPPPSSFPSLPSTHYTPRTARSPPSSLVSRPTLTSTLTHSTTRNPLRRPLSLPPTPHTSAVNIVDPSLQHTEIDISQFPAWSRSWYQAPLNPNHDLDQDIYTPIPPSHLNSTRNKHQSPFDPGYVPNHNGWDPQPPHSSSYDHSRDFVPWGTDPPEYNNPSLNPALKGERMRMLEREFGDVTKSKGKGRGNDFLDDDGKPLVGTVNDSGQLVTQGPKKRVAVRILQILLAGTAAVPSIYAAIVIKQPPPGDPPPPANKSAAFILYFLSVVTLLLLLYLFVFRPCCCSPRRRRGKDPNNPLLGNGMMVLPMHGGGGKKKGGGKGKKGGKHNPQGGGDVQVNLIVDPHAFGLGDDEDDGEELSDDGGMPGGFPDEYHRRHHKAKGRQQRRRGLLAGLAMEEDWRIARAWAKKLALVDVAGVLLWGTAFVLILMGKRCPSGQFSGWCNAYNVSSAAACLLCIAFGVNVFFDIKDLHASKLSPRTR